MRKRAISSLVMTGCLLTACESPLLADGPFARVRQRLTGAPADTPRQQSRAVRELLEANPLATYQSSRKAPPRPVTSGERLAPPASWDASVTASQLPLAPTDTAIQQTALSGQPESLLQPQPTPIQEPASAPPSSGSSSPRPLFNEGPFNESESGTADRLPSSSTGFSVGFTLEQAEQLAMQHNPSLRQAGATVHKAMGTRRQVGRYPNPTVGYSGEDIGEDGRGGNQGMFVSQTIMLGRKLELNERVADWEVQALSWQADAQRYRVRNDVRRQFYITLGAQRRVKLAEQLQQVANAGALDVKQRFDAIGDMTKVDVAQAVVQAKEVEIIRTNAYVERDAAWRQLTTLLGTPDLAYAELEDTLEASTGTRDLELAKQQLLSLSPVLAQAKAEVQRASWRIQRERAQPIPNLEVQVSGAHMNASNSDVVGVQVGVPVPLFNNNDGNVLRASADYQRACWNVRRLELALQNQLAETYQQYQTAGNKVTIYRNEILPPLDEAIDLIEKNPGTFANLPMIIARRSYFEAQLNELQALVDLRTAEVALDGLLLTGAFGELVDNEMDDTNRWNALSNQ